MAFWYCSLMTRHGLQAAEDLAHRRAKDQEIAGTEPAVDHQDSGGEEENEV